MAALRMKCPESPAQRLARLMAEQARAGIAGKQHKVERLRAKIARASKGFQRQRAL
jgi:hypothetical protein